MSDNIPSIPTVYRGITFRSRLEAKWAAMFDNLGWPWEYEPIDLDGYIPDFILQFHEPVLAEIKPALTLKECGEYTGKIIRSGWKGDVVIFGAALRLGNPEDEIRGPICCLYGQKLDFPEQSFGPGELHICEKCSKYSIYHTEMSFKCLVSGCYEGDHFLGDVDACDVHMMWAAAGESARWNPGNESK